MWKVLIGFIVFAAAALFLLSRSGGDLDLGGEKHSVEAPHETAPASSATTSASAAPASMSAAPVPASAASH